MTILGPPSGGSLLLPIATPARARSAFWELLGTRRPAAVLGVGILALATGFSLLAAPLLGKVIDLVYMGQPAAAIRGPILLLAGAVVIQGALTMAGSALVARVGETLLARVRERFVDHALDLSLDRIEQGGLGDLTSRVSEDVAAISYAVREVVPRMVNALLLMSLSMVALIVLDWRFVVAAVLIVPIQVATARWYLRVSTPVYHEARVAGGAEQAQLLESIGDAETVRALRLNEAHAKRVDRRIERSIDISFDAVKLTTIFFGRLNVAELLGLAAVLLSGFWLVQGGMVSVGTASAGALYLVNLFRPVNTALLLLEPIQLATAGFARVIGVVDLPRPATSDTTTIRAVEGSISATDVCYAYTPGHEVLSCIDLHVEPGTRVALVGASGAGKTTLAKLIAGVHRPSRGLIRLGGIPIDRFDAAALRRAVVLVTQEVHVFAGTLMEDLLLVRPDATLQTVEAALDQVGALAWARALPDGIDTVIGDGGYSLTVVQSQQLALARLVLADPLIAILDEATAEAGSAGARVLERAALAALRGRTGLIVAHRLSQAATADLILVMQAGRIIESGTHETLLAKGDEYARLWSAWQASRDQPMA